MSAHGRRAALALLFLASCTGTPKVDGPRTPLERGISFAEESRQHRVRGISSPNPTSATVTRVPGGWPLDPDSRLLVRVDPLALAGGDEARLAGAVEGLPEGMERAREALGLLEESLALEAELLEAYGQRLRMDPGRWRDSQERARFLTLRARSAGLERRIVEALLELTAQDPELEQRAEEAGDSLAKLAPVLEAVAAREVERYNATVRRATYRLRLEAFLYMDGEALPVHVPGYDTLEEGRLVPLDRRGLRLSGREAERFREAADLAEQVAAAGNRVLDAQLGLDAALAEFGRTALAPLANLVDELRSLGRELERDALAQRAARTQGAAQALLREIEGLGRDLGAEALAALGAELDALLADLGSLFGEELEVARLLAELLALEGDLLEAGLGNPARILELVERAHAAARSLVDEAPGLARVVRERLERGGRQVGADLAAQARAEVRAAFALSPLARELEAWAGLAERARSAGGRAAAFLIALFGADEGGPLASLPTPVAASEVLDVALEDARDTRIRLRNTPRSPGDSLRLRASLIEDGKPVDEHVVDFQLEWLGWHARLDPAVVFARPDGARTGSADFRFATSVAWLWSYAPHPDQRGSWANLARFLRPGLGPHAALLPFDPDETVEIGLGATLSLWDGVLQGGVGANLMDEGEPYYYVGTSLLPLLQALGGALPGSALQTQPAR